MSRYSHIRGTILERLARVKPRQGSYAVCRDAIKEIQSLSAMSLKRERDEALAERTFLLDRINSQKRLIADLEAALNHSQLQVELDRSKAA